LPYIDDHRQEEEQPLLPTNVVQSARLGGQTRIVHQAYIGTADEVAALVKDCTSPPLSAAERDFGLPGPLWL
jgi:hypothetical protein